MRFVLSCTFAAPCTLAHTPTLLSDVQGIPWKFSWRELKDMFAEVGEVERADVMYAPDGRSKVGAAGTKPRGGCSVCASHALAVC